jgi:hypothetical protein
MTHDVGDDKVPREQHHHVPISPQRVPVDDRSAYVVEVDVHIRDGRAASAVPAITPHRPPPPRLDRSDHGVSWLRFRIEVGVRHLLDAIAQIQRCGPVVCHCRVC